MLILGIETSCDETAIAVLETPTLKGRGSDRSVGVKVLSNIVSSQVKIHAPFGGVVPSLAAREHEKNLRPVFEKALKEAKVKMPRIDLIAVTVGPGLEIALWKGVNFAKALARLFKKPVIAVNHLEGHIYSNWLKPIREFSILNFKFSKKYFPALNLIVSGGHTQLVLMTGHGKYKLIGETLDDAAGEAFDKVAKMLKLGYPGGPVVAARAAEIRSKKLEVRIKNLIKFPRPMINSKNYNFSFSGLKTAVLYKIKELSGRRRKLTNVEINYICKEFQESAVDVLVTKTIRAAKEYKVRSVMLSGGVSANKLLRNTLRNKVKKFKISYFQPPLEYTGDNAAMIALAGYNKKVISNKLKVKSKRIIVDSNLRLENW